MQISELHLYPLKSAQAYTVQQAFVQPHGLNFDREIMLTELDGKFITARKDVALFHIKAFPIAQGVAFQHTTSGQIHTVFYQNFQQSQPSEVWGDQFASLVADDTTNQWFSQILGRNVQLRWLGQQSQRTMAKFHQNPLSFADSNPLLLTSTQSLAQVQQWTTLPLTMARFRPNIVIDGIEEAFAEEQWQEIQIGQVKFSVARLCTRCILTTRDPLTAELDSNSEPFRSLKKYHTNENGKPIFGIHLVPQHSGVLQIGDSLKIII